MARGFHSVLSATAELGPLPHYRRRAVVIGVYENAASALRAIQSLPEPWKKYHPWIRKIGLVQQNISARSES